MSISFLNRQEDRQTFTLLNILHIKLIDPDHYLAITQASKKWTMPIRNWKSALIRFTIEFEDRIFPY
jgi:hypothetical protein